MITMQTKGQTCRGHDRTVAVDERRCGGHLQHRMRDEDPHRQENDYADLHVGTEIIPWAEQDPNRQDRSDRRVDRQDDGKGRPVEDQPMAPSGIVEGLAEENSQEHNAHADQRCLADAAFADHVHP